MPTDIGQRRERSMEMARNAILYAELFCFSICPYANALRDGKWQKRPTMKWKNLQTERLTPDELRAHFAMAQHYRDGIGVVTGALSGIVVVDADDADADEFVRWGCPATPWIVATGRPGKGRHYGYRHPGLGVRIRNQVKVGGLRLDVRADGGFCVLPPSVHYSGAKYRFEATDLDFPVQSLDELPVFDSENWPGWPKQRPKESRLRIPRVVTTGIVREHISTPERVEQARRYLMAVPSAVEGMGGRTRTLRATYLIAVGFDLDVGDALAALCDWNARCSPPWSMYDLANMISGARRRGASNLGFLLAEPCVLGRRSI